MSAKPSLPAETKSHIASVRRVISAARVVATMLSNRNLMEDGWYRDAVRELNDSLEAYDRLPNRPAVKA